MNRLLTILGVSLIAAFLVVSCAIEIASTPGVWQAGSYAETAPLALCIAFLRALQAQQETSEDE